MSTKIEWCTETWNPIIGCTKISPACNNCYAERMAKRLAAIGIEGYSEVIDENGKWNNRQFFNDAAIYKPLSWKKPRRIFVVSMGDLFHESAHRIWIDKVMAIAALKPEHTFLILTKRPESMHAYFTSILFKLVERWENASLDMGIADKHDDVDAPACFIHNRVEMEWPLKNVWLGVTAEDQLEANERIPWLLATPAAKRFVSVEPMLGNIDLVNVYHDPAAKKLPQLGFIDWVICGGESGPGARPMDPEWVRFLQVQCKVASVPFFFKQWGEWYNYKRVGKKAAGHLLDGIEYREFPC